MQTHFADILPPETYLLSEVPPSGCANKLANLQRLAELQETLNFRVPDTYVLAGLHFAAALNNVVPGSSDRLLIETLDPQTANHFRQSLLVRPLPATTLRALRAIHRAFTAHGVSAALCVRSCYELEDQPEHSLAGAFETVHSVVDFDTLCGAVQVVFASVFSDAALSELNRLSLTHFPRMSVAIQLMLGGEGWSGGVAHTQSPDFPSHPLMLISAADSSSSVTSGSMIPEDYLVHREALNDPSRRVAIQIQAGTLTTDRFLFNDDQVRAIGSTFLALEREFSSPLEIEWLCSDLGELYLLQARAAPPSSEAAPGGSVSAECKPFAQGIPVGQGLVTAPVFVAKDATHARRAPPGSVLITHTTDPAWTPAIRDCAAVVAASGSRTSHVARTAREAGVLAVVGCGEKPESLNNGTQVTVYCSDGIVGAVYLDHPVLEHCSSPSPHVDIRSVATAFTLAKSSTPLAVTLDLTGIVASLRMPAQPGLLTARLKRRIAGYRAPSDFVRAKLLEAVCLVAIAFPKAKLSLVLPAGSPWYYLLPDLAKRCSDLYGFVCVTVATPSVEDLNSLADIAQ